MSLKNIFWSSAAVVIPDTVVWEVKALSTCVCLAIYTHVSPSKSWAPSAGSLQRLVLIFSNFWHYTHGVWIALSWELSQWVASEQWSYSTDLTHCRKHSSLKRCFMDFDWSTDPLLLFWKMFIIWQEKNSTIYGFMYKYIYANTIHFMYSKELLWNYLSVL